MVFNSQGKKKTVGTIKVCYKANEAIITNWVVAWAFRRLGIGKTLLLQALSQIKQEPGISRIILKTVDVSYKKLALKLLIILKKELNFEVIEDSEELVVDFNV